MPPTRIEATAKDVNKRLAHQAVIDMSFFINNQHPKRKDKENT
jgi:hypothetical protein